MNYEIFTKKKSHQKMLFRKEDFVRASMVQNEQYFIISVCVKYKKRIVTLNIYGN